MIRLDPAAAYNCHELAKLFKCHTRSVSRRARRANIKSDGRGHPPYYSADEVRVMWGMK